MLGWHSPADEPQPGLITVQTADFYAMARVWAEGDILYIESEDGPDVDWSQVQRWAEVPVDACRLDGCFLVAKLH